MTCLWVSYAWRPLWSVLQSCERFPHVLTVGCELIFCKLPQICIISFCLRHWNVADYTLPIKMCGTHLGVIVSVVCVGSVSHLLRCEAHTLGWERKRDSCSFWLNELWHRMAWAWWVAGMHSMPKLYISPGLSERVHLALTRRLESFMAGSSVSAMPAEMGTVEIPTVPGAPAEWAPGSRWPWQFSCKWEQGEWSVTDLDHQGELNVPEPNPDNPLEVLSACASLAVGVTSMVAALKTSSEKAWGVDREHTDVAERSGPIYGHAGHGVESMAGGVSYNTGRVGALCGEFQKVRKHLEWSLDRSLGDLAKEASKKRAEDTTQMTALLQQVFEAMDRFQENIKEVAHRMESLKITASVPEKESRVWTGDCRRPAMWHPWLLRLLLVCHQALSHHLWHLQWHLLWHRHNRHNHHCRRNVSPTRQHNPATGTAAFSPLGYVVLKNTNDFRRVYP